jgi:hypothetical protein
MLKSVGFFTVQKQATLSLCGLFWDIHGWIRTVGERVKKVAVIVPLFTSSPSFPSLSPHRCCRFLPVSSLPVSFSAVSLFLCGLFLPMRQRCKLSLLFYSMVFPCSARHCSELFFRSSRLMCSFPCCFVLLLPLPWLTMLLCSSQHPLPARAHPDADRRCLPEDAAVVCASAAALLPSRCPTSMTPRFSSSLSVLFHPKNFCLVGV